MIVGDFYGFWLTFCFQILAEVYPGLALSLVLMSPLITFALLCAVRGKVSWDSADPLSMIFGSVLAISLGSMLIVTGLLITSILSATFSTISGLSSSAVLSSSAPLLSSAMTATSTSLLSLTLSNMISAVTMLASLATVATLATFGLKHLMNYFFSSNTENTADFNYSASRQFPVSLHPAFRKIITSPQVSPRKDNVKSQDDKSALRDSHSSSDKLRQSDNGYFSSFQSDDLEPKELVTTLSSRPSFSSY